MAGRYALHEAMKIVLLDQPDQTASTQTIRDVLASRDLYHRRNGEMAPRWQIWACATRYPRLFEKVAPQVVRLMGPAKTADNPQDVQGRG
jgi:hypothetical protein